MPARHITPEIIIDDPQYVAAGKLKGKVAIVTGGDSGIGAATAIVFAKEGADIVISYLQEDRDAEHIAEVIKVYGQRCLVVKGDLGNKEICREVVAQTLTRFGNIDILVNNAGTQVQQQELKDIDEAQLRDTFQTNLFSMFFLTQAALPHMGPETSITNTASVTAYRGHQQLIDYSATKGAIVAFTRSLSQNLAERRIRVNAVAPGPIWTPLVLTSFDQEKLATFGTSQPLGRAGQPVEVAPAYAFLASRDARYITGQVIHVNGGEIING